MSRCDSAGPRPGALALIAIAGVLLASCLVAARRPWSSAPPRAADGNRGSRVDTVPPAPLVLGGDTRMLVFGDSWTYGSAATVRTDGYAFVAGRLLGWETIVDGVRGSGYLKAGIDGPSFPDRVGSLDPTLDPDLVVIQGSINDRRLHGPRYPSAVGRTWDALSATYPAAAIVVLGPAPQVLPVEPATMAIDADLRALATGRDWWYISPIRDEWITRGNYLDVIDTGTTGRDHPSTAGHAYLARRLVEALRSMTDAGARHALPEA